MIFKSEKWELDTEKVTVTNLESGEQYEFYEDCVRYHLHHSEEYFPERLQKLVDNGEILAYLEKLEIKVKDAINEQTEIWCSQDKNFQIAKESGNLNEVGRIANMYRIIAERSIYETMVYV